MALLDRYHDLLQQHSSKGKKMLRWSLGVTMLLAGLHKLLDPVPWAAYVAQPFAQLMPLDPVVEMQWVEGPVEALLGLGILADYRTELLASVTAALLFLIVVNILLIGGFLDLVIRDIGLLGLAIGVALLAADDR